MGFVFLIMWFCNWKKFLGGIFIGGFLVLLERFLYLDLIKIIGDLFVMKFFRIVNYIRKFLNSFF